MQNGFALSLVPLSWCWRARWLCSCLVCHPLDLPAAQLEIHPASTSNTHAHVFSLSHTHVHTYVHAHGVMQDDMVGVVHVHLAELDVWVQQDKWFPLHNHKVLSSLFPFSSCLRA